MEFRGNLYQDYTSLKNLYDWSGKIILTGNIDVDYQILSQLDLQDLSKTCRSNKYTQDLCSSDDFWIYKFNQENLNILYKPDTLQKWLILYKKTKHSTIDAIHTLIVYDILYKNDPSPIIIKDNLNNAFLNNMFYQIEKPKNSYYTQGSRIIKYISITPSNSIYNLELNFKNGNSTIEILSKSKLIEFLSYVYQFSWPNDNQFNVEYNYLPLIITKNYVITQQYDNDREVFLRKGILDTIIYYEQL